MARNKRHLREGESSRSRRKRFRRRSPSPSINIERMPVYTPGAKEEKIFVTVRVRPLNDTKDESVWECTNSHTIQYRGDTTSSYTFDRVFGPTTLTETVYEEGAKVTALSALEGINATIFSYGQTGSGKTFTMQGVTESAVSDIYNHIRNTPERKFTIKMSAMEIYNENVKDLLMPDSCPLRLLDLPEKGTIVENLEEQTAKDSQHLMELISKCEAQRQVGETRSNKRSSRSHQTIRLIVESCLRENSGRVKSFVAVLNFVDLAGSERVAQTHAKGKTLEEGCHINKSLLALTKVIRKLSENKSGHIPYRDSKLTRILELSLGGNARTAIICTLSPRKSNKELSRSTLFFAMSAKKVTNIAQVNMVVSEKQKVKHLQKEVARLAAELRAPEATNSDAILLEKDMMIKQMEEEIEALKKERLLVNEQHKKEMKALKKERDLSKFKFDEQQKKITGLYQRLYNAQKIFQSRNKTSKN